MPEWVPACAIGDIEPEDVMPFLHNGVDYAIYRSPDGEFFATAGHCTHENTLLCDGLVIGKIIECPKHHGQFEYATGKAVRRPALVNLQTYPVRVDADIVYIAI